MKTVVTIRIFGIPFWQIIRYSEAPPVSEPIDKEAFKKELTESIFKQLDRAVLNARRGGA